MGRVAVVRLSTELRDGKKVRILRPPFVFKCLNVIIVNKYIRPENLAYFVKNKVKDFTKGSISPLIHCTRIIILFFNGPNITGNFLVYIYYRTMRTFYYLLVILYINILSNLNYF